MLKNLLGSVNKERVLIFLVVREQGYAREISRFFNASLFPVQNALEAMERAAVLVSHKVGNTRIYEFNPRYPARDELMALLKRALALYPEKLRQDLLQVRSRPRRKGKPL